MRTVVGCALLGLAALIGVGCGYYGDVTTFEDEANLDEYREGWVEWEILESTCPADLQEAWTYPTYGVVRVTEDEVVLTTEQTPELRGARDGDSADVAGDMIFMGDTEEITCDVQGRVALEDDGMEGEITEDLSSDTEVNCATRFAFDLRYDYY